VKYTSPTLLTLAALVLAPAANAVDINDADVKLGLSLQLQVRAEVSKAEDSTGASYNVAEGTVTQPDAVDFYIRRGRFGLVGTYKDDVKFGFIVRADNEDKKPATAGTGDVVGRALEVQQFYLGRDIKQGDLTHYIQAGLDYAFFNGPSGVASSKTALFVNARATENSALLAPRGVGVKYKLTAPHITWGFDIQNNTGDGANAADNGEGMCYTTRLHFSPEGEWKIATPTESFLGKDGKGVLVAIEYGKNVDNVVAATIVDTSAFGLEVYGHFDKVSALAEVRDVKTTEQVSETDVKARVWLLQAGYALPCPLVKGAIMEPALRYTKIDLDTEDDAETSLYGSAEYGNSGTQFDVGVNYYLDGKANTKFSLDYSNWSAEEGDAKAQIVRLQAQLYF
jgi:hypothetical protein